MSNGGRKKTAKRVTMPAKQRKTKAVVAAQTPPSKEEWKTMERLASVEVDGKVFREKDE